MEGVVIWTATGLATKMVADLLRRTYGFSMPGRVASARGPVEADIAYGIAFGAALILVLHIGVAAALAVALVLRCATITADRVVLSGNHPVLELYLALVCLRLHAEPATVTPVLQVMTTSVWVYAAFQKLYHHEFPDGSFFYITMQFSRPVLGTWSRYVRKVPRIEGSYGAVDPAAQAFCRRLATVVLVSEAAPPLLAFAASGTIWSTLLLVGISVPVGVLTSETNFMITNVLLALVFLEPFSMPALLGALSDPVVASVVGWCLVWPPLHAVLSRRLRFSPWKLAGWGMYSRHEARVDVVDAAGELRIVTGGGVPVGMLRSFGACRSAWVRDRVLQYFLRWGHQGAVRAVIFRWYRRRGQHFVTSCVVVPHAPGCQPFELEIRDRPTAEAFQRCAASFRRQPHAAGNAPGTAVPCPPGFEPAAGAGVRSAVTAPEAEA